MDKCKRCNKYNPVFKQLDTGENICLWCGIKMQYTQKGLKGVYKLLKFHLKNRWYFSWSDKLAGFLVHFILISLSIISLFSLIYVVYIGEFILIPTCILSIFAVKFLWCN